MRKLLFLSHRIPYPPNKGDKIRSFHILKHLATRYQIFLGCFYEESADQKHLNALRSYCSDVFGLPISQTSKIVRGLKGLMSGRSISESVYKDGRMSGWIKQTLDKENISDVFVFCSSMTPYLNGRASGRMLVFDFVDVDSAKWGAYAASARPPLSWCFALEEHRVRVLEVRAAAIADQIVVASKAEAELLRTLVPRSKSLVSVVENGVDSKEFDPGGGYVNPFNNNSLPIVFTGAMDYRPNVDAVEWFARNVFPTIRSNLPRAEFWIVGYRPTAAVRRLARIAGVHVTGQVPDVRPYLGHGACVVSPLKIARGVQNKVLEAMAMAKPTVVTPAALEGLGAEQGRDVLVADDAGQFALRVMEVLSGKRQRLGSSARGYVTRRHEWAATLRPLDFLFSDRADPDLRERALVAASAGQP